MNAEDQERQERMKRNAALLKKLDADIKALDAAEKVAVAFLASFGWTMIFGGVVLCPVFAWLVVSSGGEAWGAGIAFGVFGLMLVGLGVWALSGTRDRGSK